MKRNSEWRLNQTTVHENGPMSQNWLTVNEPTRTQPESSFSQVYGDYTESKIVT